MKNLRGSCVALASALSAKYAAYQEYRPGLNLNHYLNENGVLISMCLNRHFNLQPYCGFGKKERIFSTSWIQQKQTGFRAYHDPSDRGFPLYIGMVVDPTAHEIQCLYPVDAMAAGRDDLVGDDGVTAKACGPVWNDPRFGSKGFDNLPVWKQLLIRAGWNEYARYFFENNRNVSCKVFFGQAMDEKEPLDDGMLVIQEANQTQACQGRPTDFVYQTYVDALATDIEHQVGHKLCKQSRRHPYFDRFHYLTYSGRCSWRPEQFADMLATMKTIDKLHPRVLNWNEIVLDRPTNLSDSVQAVFYVEQWSDGENDRKYYRNAQSQAQQLGKHLFTVQREDHHKPLFQCNTSAPELAAMVLAQA